MTRPAKQSSDAAKVRRSRQCVTTFSANGRAGWWGIDYVQVSVPEGLTQSAETVELCAAYATRLQLPLFTALAAPSSPAAALKPERAQPAFGLFAWNTAWVRRAPARVGARGDPAKRGSL